MAGRSKHRRFCWADTTKPECPVCRTIGNAFASHTCIGVLPTGEVCGHQLVFKCHMRLLPGEACRWHHQEAKGPDAYNARKELAKVQGPPVSGLEEVAGIVAASFPPNLRPLLARYLRQLSLGEASNLLAARAHTLVDQRAMEGGDVDGMLRIAGDLYERAARVRFVGQASENPKEQPDVYDWSQLTPEEAELAERLLKKARIQTGEDQAPVASIQPAPVVDVEAIAVDTTTET